MTAIGLEAFRLHSNAFTAMGARDLAQTAQLFGEALRSFAQLVVDSHFKALVQSYASKLVGADVTEAIANELLERLPRWLLEVHTEMACEAVARRDPGLAGVHLRLLASATELDALSPGRGLELARNEIIRRFTTGDDQRQDEASNARDSETLEIILAADPGNQRARELARRTYRFEVSNCLAILDPQPDALRVGKRGYKSRRSAPRARQRLRRVAARLARHLEMLRPESSTLAIPSNDLAYDFAAVAHSYALISRQSGALRYARRARSLARDDEKLEADLKAFIRRLRRR